METPGQTMVSEVFVAMVEAFLECTGMLPGTFGRLAVGDADFVRQLRGGRSPTLRTVDRVVACIEALGRGEGGEFAFSGPGRLRERVSRAWRGRRWVESEPEDAVHVRMLRLSAVLARTGLSRTTMYKLMGEGSFPKPVRLGGQAAGWVEAEVDGWIRGRVAESRAASGRAGRPADS